MPSERNIELRVCAVALVLSMLPVAVLFALRGYSCGHDLPFHLGSWQDAAQQLGHGGWPQWDYMAARSAGEPRFVFYPPLSWLVGAALRGVMSPEYASMAFVLLALSACWCAMYAAARRYAGSAVAMVSATAYAASPYALYNALERSAFAELLAMAWLPLLFTAVMRKRVSVVAMAVPMALLWLTNVPTAIIGSYMVALLGVARVMTELRTPGARSSTKRFSLTVVAGVAIGIGLAGFFLVPAVHQQAAVQINAAFSEGQTVADNFLIRHTEHTRRGVIHEVSLMTAEALGVLGILLVLVWRSAGLRPSRSEDGQPLLLLAAFVVLLMLPWSAPVWAILPKLSVLQFPWRLLCLLWMVVALAVALCAGRFSMGHKVGLACAFLVAAALAWSGFRQFWLDPQGHENGGAARVQNLVVVERRATSEYTPVGAENDTLQASPPGYWLQVRSTGLAGGAGHGDVVEQALPQARAGSDAAAPAHLELELAQAEVLVLDLRAYPQWHVTRNGVAATLLPRADGLIAVALPAGGSMVDVEWVSGWDRVVGWLVSVMALGLLALSSRRRPELWRRSDIRPEL